MRALPKCHKAITKVTKGDKFRHRVLSIPRLHVHLYILLIQDVSSPTVEPNSFSDHTPILVTEVIVQVNLLHICSAAVGWFWQHHLLWTVGVS